jgi:hypothetical protein
VVAEALAFSVRLLNHMVLECGEPAAGEQHVIKSLFPGLTELPERGAICPSARPRSTPSLLEVWSSNCAATITNSRLPKEDSQIHR